MQFQQLQSVDGIISAFFVQPILLIIVFYFYFLKIRNYLVAKPIIFLFQAEICEKIVFYFLLKSTV